MRASESHVESSILSYANEANARLRFGCTVCNYYIFRFNKGIFARFSFGG